MQGDGEGNITELISEQRAERDDRGSHKDVRSMGSPSRENSKSKGPEAGQVWYVGRAS